MHDLSPSKGFKGPSRIMIVDDTPANLTLLKEMLHLQEKDVFLFPSGAMALKAAEKNPPDLILLDITMPEMDGYDVCQRLKENPALRDIPVIFLSAMSSTRDKVKAFKVGAADYITKPFQFSEVQRRVETQLRLSRMQQELSSLIVEREECRNAFLHCKELHELLMHTVTQTISPQLQALIDALKATLDSIDEAKLSPLLSEAVHKALASNSVLLEITEAMAEADSTDITAEDLAVTLRSLAVKLPEYEGVLIPV